MKKTSKMFGAVALSAALAAGMALPAFAAGGAEVGADSNDIMEAGNNNSIINLVAYESPAPKPILPEVPQGTYSLNDLRGLSDPASDGDLNNLNTVANYQMIANIPVSATVAVMEEGGPLTTPTNYSIKNRGYSDVYVNNITAKPATGWELSRVQVEDNNAMYLDLTEGLTTVELPAENGDVGGAVTSDFEIEYNGKATTSIKQAENSAGEKLFLLFQNPNPGTAPNSTTLAATYVTEEQASDAGATLKAVPAGSLTVDALPAATEFRYDPIYMPVMVSLEDREICNNSMNIGLKGEAWLPSSADEGTVLKADTPNVMRVVYTIASKR